jgi:hypothetical protein
MAGNERGRGGNGCRVSHEAPIMTGKAEPSHSQISTLSTAIVSLGKARSRREPNVGYRGLTDLGDVLFCPSPPKKTSLHDGCRMSRPIVMMKMPVTTCKQPRSFSSFCISQPANDFDVVLLSYCMDWRRVLVVDSTVMTNKPSSWP